VKNKCAWILGLTALLRPLVGGEFEDFQLIQRAYDDQLYLFVEEKAQVFLSNERYDHQGKSAKEVQVLWIGALVERGAYEEALERLNQITLDSKLTYLKARALFGAYVERGKPLPEDSERPSVLLAKVNGDLSGYEKVMAQYVYSQDLFEIYDYKKASVVLRNIVNGEKLFRHYEAAKFLFGRSLYYEDPPRFEEALDVFKSLSLKYSRSLLACRYEFWQGECYFEMNHLAEAEIAFKKALTLNPDNETVVDVHYNLGWLYAAMGRLEESMLELQAVLKEPMELSARYQVSTRYKLASLFLVQKKGANCREILKPILRDSTLEYEASLLAAQAAMLDGQWALALEDLSHARLSPVKEINLEASRLLGKVHLELKDFITAEAILKTLVEHEVPLDFRIDVQLQLADIYYGMDDVYHAQDIYQQLLAEKSKKLEPMLHYNLARCAMRSNPLVECVYRRDALLKRKASGHFNEADEKSEKEAIAAKVRQVMSRIWIMSSSGSSSLTKPNVLMALEKLGGVSMETKKNEILARYLSEGNKIPNDTALESEVLTALISDFVAAFWKSEGAILPYTEVTESLMTLGKYYPALQVTNISSHLDHIIQMGEESPYLSLAYYEKYQLYQQQGLTGDAMESLFYAVEKTVDPERRASYLLQLARREMQAASAIEGDPKSTQFKIKKALGHLDEVENLTKENSRELVDLRFNGYSMLLDYERAEETLVTELSKSRDPETIRIFEEQLISFYQRIDRPIKAAQRRLIYAERLSVSDPIEAQRQRYEASVILLENEHSHEEGVRWLQKIAQSAPMNEWTLRAGLKCVDIYQRKGETEQADALLQTMVVQSSTVELPLQLEIRMTEGRQALAKDHVKDAAKAFEDVMMSSDDLPALKAMATLELGKALKNVEPERAADVFLKFYYLFPKHSKNQEALYESCRLQAFMLKKAEASVKTIKTKELLRLVEKLEQDQDRQNLKTYLDSI
jgi:tetratricopeptide (TPR) repeat protein